MLVDSCKVKGLRVEALVVQTRYPFRWCIFGEQYQQTFHMYQHQRKLYNGLIYHALQISLCLIDTLMLGCLSSIIAQRLLYLVKVYCQFKGSLWWNDRFRLEYCRSIVTATSVNTFEDDQICDSHHIVTQKIVTPSHHCSSLVLGMYVRCLWIT